MNAETYRRIKIAVGGLVLGSASLVFADIGDWVPARVARWLLWPQFTPSILNLAEGAGWVASGCIAILLLTLLFGRIYCAMLCPLGVLMDLSARLARRTGRRRKLSYRPGKPWLRTLVAITCGGGLLAGTALPLAFLDPYSLFGKITAATLRPLLGSGNHLFASAKWIQPIDVSPVAWTTIGVALALLALIVFAAIQRGRIWCNTICPVGAVLGFISRHSLFRLEISAPKCVGCSMCERVCPSQCIDFRNHRIDHSRCIMCLECVASCKRSGISLHRGGQKKPEKQDPVPAKKPAKTRAAFLSNRRGFLATALAVPTTALAASRKLAAREDLHQHNKRPVLPPGARSLAHFQSRCTACHLCVANCPDQVLRPSITEHGLSGFLQPYQDFSVAFCSYNCSNCSQICPTGAIQPLTLEDRRTVRTGIAHFFQDRCVVKTKGTSCGACNEHCPTQAVHMVPWKNNLTIPEVDPDLCIGCGGCEFICPVRPHKAIVVDGLITHERAKPVNRGKQNSVREIEEEFPF